MPQIPDAPSDSALTLRRFCVADAPRIAQLVTESVRGHWSYTATQFRESQDESRVRLVAVQNGEITCTAAFAPFSLDLPDTLRLSFAGEPAEFSALYLALLGHLPAGVRRLLGVIREDWPPMQLFHAAGFRNAWQSWGAHLDLRAFDFTPYQQAEERLFMRGYEIERLVRGAAASDWAALHTLYVQGVQDAPRNPTTTPGTLTAGELQGAIEREEVVFVVRLRGEIVASTRFTPRSHQVESEHTVTHRAHRGQGLATVLKAHALRWARAEGYTQAGTGGTVLNLPMLRVNTRLGYVTEPMWITWELLLPSADRTLRQPDRE